MSPEQQQIHAAMRLRHAGERQATIRKMPRQTIEQRTKYAAAVTAFWDQCREDRRFLKSKGIKRWPTK